MDDYGYSKPFFHLNDKDIGMECTSLRRYVTVCMVDKNGNPPGVK